jgi:hypothetical protein
VQFSDIVVPVVDTVTGRENNRLYISGEELTDAADSKAGGAVAIAGATLGAALAGREAGPEGCLCDIATAKDYSPVGVGPRVSGARRVWELDHTAEIICIANSLQAYNSDHQFIYWQLTKNIEWPSCVRSLA